MRNLIIASAIALAASTAAANPFAEVENQGGGKITLLTDTCQAKPQLSRAYFYTSIGVTEDGCWSYDGDTIVVEWISMDGETDAEQLEAPAEEPVRRRRRAAA